MEITVVEDKKNPLLGRREVRFKARYAGATPKRAEVRKNVTSMLNSDDSLTILDRFETSYGATEASGYVKVYDNAEALKIEPEYKVKRNFPAEKKPEEEAAAGEAPKEKAAGEAPKEKAAGESGDAGKGGK